MLEMTDFFIDNYGLKERIRDVLLIIFAAGLPVAIFLAWFLGRDKETSIKKEDNEAVDKRTKGILIALRTRPWFSIPGVVVIILLLLTSIRYVNRQTKINWAREQALPRMQNRVHDWDHVSAFELRQEVKKYIPDDPEFKRLDTLVTKSFTILTEPEGADIYYKEYPDVESEWEFLGTTPIPHVEMPNMTMYRWKMVKDDFEDLFAVAKKLSDRCNRLEDADFSESLDKIKEAANQVGKSWSGSWLGYHSCVYYERFAEPPTGARCGQSRPRP